MARKTTRHQHADAMQLRKARATYLDPGGLLVHEDDVLGLQVSVYDAMLMTVPQRTQDLLDLQQTRHAGEVTNTLTHHEHGR